MQLEHEFTVPVPVDDAWQALLDLERVAPCMPGATLKSVEGNEFSGSVKVKLGPVSLLYKGSGSFTSVDPEAHRAVVDASGKDSRGNGTASATVSATLRPEGTSTAVHVSTDLKVTGKPAQLGRGLISDVTEKLIDQFANCLAERLTGTESDQAAAPATTGETAGATGDGHGPAVSRNGHLPEGEQPVPASEQADEQEQQEIYEGRTGWKVTGVETSGQRSDSETARPGAGNSPEGATVGGKREAAELSADSEDVVDLLDTAGMPVLKRLVPVVAAVVGLAAVLVALRRRTNRNR
ncbi:SRPBCC family protein [Actinopolyspora halophila]|uniref:SRPBCC family protein n=1 Tax=Actinopolyspora halophila TaxID=1850 RepID=UPI00035C35AD|nr:SRPBCC family protein [Actinopolyspora halophila]